MRLHQVVVSASPRDAVTGSAFALRTLLREVCESEIYALNIDPQLQHEVRSIHEFPQARRGDREQLILFHASIGSPEVFRFLTQRPEQLVMMYHNISPAAAFAPYDPVFADLLRAGRDELAGLRERTVLALAPSQFNADELLALGYADVRVSPLIIDVDRLTALEPLAPTVDYLAERVRGHVFLFVGQQLPHKRPDFLLKAFHILSTHLLPDCHLMMIGPARLDAYRDLLVTFRRELNLRDAALIGSVSDEELVAHYRRADVFVTASEHEGFCVPLLEAMAFEVPVLARSFAAVPETVGGAGLVLPQDGGPALFAEAMAALATTPEVREECTVGGRRRLRHYAPADAKATFLRHLGTVL